jgi:hypothetical protein
MSTEMGGGGGVFELFAPLVYPQTSSKFQRYIIGAIQSVVELV